MDANISGFTVLCSCKRNVGVVNWVSAIHEMSLPQTFSTTGRDYYMCIYQHTCTHTHCCERRLHDLVNSTYNSHHPRITNCYTWYLDNYYSRWPTFIRKHLLHLLSHFHTPNILHGLYQSLPCHWSSTTMSLQPSTQHLRAIVLWISTLQFNVVKVK